MTENGDHLVDGARGPAAEPVDGETGPLMKLWTE